MRVAIFGANGPTGRLLTRQALDAGHHVVAATRRPESFPMVHEHLEVAAADIHDPGTVSTTVDGCDAVLSTLGVPFTRKPAKVDPELWSAIQLENTRQQEHIELIASENYTSPA